MITPERAKDILKEFKIEDGLQRQYKDAEKLAEPLRGAALGLIGYKPDGVKWDSYQERNETQKAAVDVISTLTSQDRLKIFQALAPTIAEEMDSAWELCAKAPYQYFYSSRRAYRAPGDSKCANAIRARLLEVILPNTGLYRQDIVWYAEHATFIYEYWSDVLGLLFAATIEKGGPKGERVFQLFCDTARGEHPVSVFGRHVTRGLMVASRPEGWELIEKLLLAAQRQEGLRQVIFETIDEAHPEAFRRMLHLILDNDLTRFSSLTRAIDTWLGYGYDVMDAKAASRTLVTLLRMIEDESARRSAIATETGEDLFLALHTLALIDAHEALNIAVPILNDAESAERRYIATRFIAGLGLKAGNNHIISMLGDPSLHCAIEAFRCLPYSEELAEADTFERIEALLLRVKPGKKQLEPSVWPWNVITVDRGDIADKLINYRGPRPASRLIARLPDMSSSGRYRVAQILAYQPEVDPESRDILLSMTADLGAGVREHAFKGLARSPITEAEAQRIEALLTRKAGDVRRGAITLLMAQTDEAAASSATRLLAAKSADQQDSGAEILEQMRQAKRSPDVVASKVQQTLEVNKQKISQPILSRLEKLSESSDAVKAATLDDALGLAILSERSAPTLPQIPERWRGLSQDTSPLESEAANRLVRSLDDFAFQYRETEVTVEWYGGKETKLFGDITHGFSGPGTAYYKDNPIPLMDAWERWNSERTDALRDPDGQELHRALTAVYTPKLKDCKMHSIVRSIIDWLIYLHPSEGETDFLLDVVEYAFARIPAEVLFIANAGRYATIGAENMPGKEWRTQINAAESWLARLSSLRGWRPNSWTKEQIIRHWGLLRWWEQPHPKSALHWPDLTDLLAAYEAGAATSADVYMCLLGPRPVAQYGGTSFNDLRRVSGRKMGEYEAKHPWIRAFADRCRDRVVEVEVQRGEIPVASSTVVSSLMYSGSLDALVKIVQAMGPLKLDRSVSSWNTGMGKAEVLSRLLQRTFPAETDTKEAFCEALLPLKIPHQRLVEIAIFAPQWSGHIEHMLGWPEFENAVWWFHAHTKDAQYSFNQESREAWNAEIGRRTPLESQDLIDGAVDVAWFQQVRSVLPEKAWKLVSDAAKYASSGTGHSRAKLFSDAMSGNLAEADALKRILDKRHPDSVRSLGLIPLPNRSPDARKAVILQRYAAIQEFRRGSKQFGAMRQASEKLAASIALQNLARTAGYPDPVRLEWAMEREAVADLMDGPVEATHGDLKVQLSIDDFGVPDLSAIKADKVLKSIPPVAKKAPAIAALSERKQEIARQSSRVRISLEEAMCRGDYFTGREVQELMTHPVIRPMLRSLVLIGEDTRLSGYPSPTGRSLIHWSGEEAHFDEDVQLRIAHPHDLFSLGQWDKWQWDCFARERIQPFKQVFRELYLLTKAEKEDGVKTSRYAGHQINRKQAAAILGKRGWITSFEQDECTRTFHAEGLTVSLTFDYGYTTPAEVEGLTIADAYFQKRGQLLPAKFDDVPPRVFSEAMRDLDLVVSVAHVGGVDPEASASTVEMRTSLLRDAIRLLRIDNVRLLPNHAMVDGKLGNYSVHLGSGTVHRQPGGHLCIVPVHSQHRGRMFLPFAADDPRSAEILSKVVLLSKDYEIKDPIILEQIYAGG
jgi:hypothetical protein